MFAELRSAADIWSWRPDIARVRREAPGWLTSLFLHGLALALVLLVLNVPLPKGQNGMRFVPVTLVPFGGNSVSPRAGENAAPVPALTPSLTHRQSSAIKPAAVSPSKTKSAPDELEAQLERLSKAQAPEEGNVAAAPNFAATEPGEGGEGEGTGGAYGVRDLVRAQVLRRWSLNIGELDGQTFTIPIHVLMRRDGTVLKAEVVDSKRFHTDKLYRDIAISARNAVILSSPLMLPAGNYPKTFEVTIMLNSQDTLR